MDIISSTSGIYKITCLANKRIYIGSAVNLLKRKRDHFNTLRRNNHCNIHMQRAWNKYSPDVFTFEVLEYVLPMSLTAREQYWLNKLKPGFNILREAGSPLGTKRSPESIEKSRQGNIGKKNTPEAIEASRQARTGMKRSPEFCESMRQSKLGVKRTPEAAKKSADGHRGKKQSLATRKKRSQTLLGHPGAMLGKRHTPEAREKMRQSALAMWEKRRNEHA